MKLAREVLVVVLFVAFLAACGIIPPELRYRRALHKYRIGITAEAIERDYGTHLDLQPTGNILPPGFGKEDQRRHPAYETRLPHECIIVIFNDFHEVRYVQRFTPILRIEWWFEGKQGLGYDFI
jgi:hypothetical protein